MIRGMLGKKVGMTQFFDESGNRVGVTVLEMSQNRVMQVRNADNDGYDALQLGIDEKKKKHCGKAELGHAGKAEGGMPCRFVRELRLDEPADVEAGSVLKVDEVFDGVEKVQVTGTSKGKGFAGVMKRYGFGGFRATHGVKTHHRHSGSIGQCQDPGRVFKGKKMAGHMGHRRISTKGIRVVKIIPEKSLLLVRGPIPGPNGGYVFVRESQGYKAPK
jgi:large subunit ribosomal protein L3